MTDDPRTYFRRKLQPLVEAVEQVHSTLTPDDRDLIEFLYTVDEYISEILHWEAEINQEAT